MASFRVFEFLLALLAAVTSAACLAWLWPSCDSSFSNVTPLRNTRAPIERYGRYPTPPAPEAPDAKDGAPDAKDGQ